MNPACASSSSDGSDATAESETSFVERDTRAWLDTMVIGMNLCPFARAAMPGTKIIVPSHVTDMPSLHSVIEAELAILADAPTDPPVTTLVVLPPTVVATLDATTHGGFMEGAVRVAEDATRHLTAQRDTEKDRDGDLIDVVPFHPNAIFGGDVDEEDESQSNGYICTYLDVDEEGAEESAEGGADTAVSTPPSTEELRRMIEAHEGFTGGADRRADWKAANSPVVNEKSNEKDLEDEGPTDPADYTGRSPHPILHLLRRCDVDAADDSWFGEKGPGTDIRAANAASLRAKGEADLAKMLRRCLTAHHPRDVYR